MGILEKIVKKIRSYRRKSRTRKEAQNIMRLKESYFTEGQIPWSPGYNYHKTEKIIEAISNENLKESIHNRVLPKGYGYRIDERIVEYAWIFSTIPEGTQRFLDAGSTFNFPYIVSHPLIEKKDLTIFTYSPEHYAFNRRRISYVYGDLREMSLKDSYFDLVVSQSTIEHIDMDNSMYGYELEHNKNVETKSYDYLIAVDEMVRVLKSGGTLLLTFPFGKFENHGFFQQFDSEMVKRMTDIFQKQGSYDLTYFKYDPEGWRFAEMNEVTEMESFNPHTGRGLKEDHAAHSRAILCVKFVKN